METSVDVQPAASRFQHDSYAPAPSHSFAQWMEDGASLRHLQDATPWMIGDWINHGERAYGERYSQALSELGYSYYHVARLSLCCRAFPPSCRKMEIRDGFRLTMGHHMAVMHLKEEERDAWLERALDERWPIRQLKIARKVATDQGDTISHPLLPPSEDPYRARLFSALEEIPHRAVELCHKGSGEWWEEILLDGDGGEPLKIKFSVQVS